MMLNKLLRVKIEDLPRFFQSGPAQVYVYYCDLCQEVLLISRFLINLHKVNYAFKWTCPDCGCNLNEYLQCQTTNFSVNASFIHPICKDRGLLREPQRFNLPTLIPHLYGGPNACTIRTRDLTNNYDRKYLIFNENSFNVLSDFLGRLTVLYGSPLCNQISETICVDAQLPLQEGGLNSTAILIDGGNAFNPYLISDYAQQRGVDVDNALEKVVVSRAFTCYQLTSLITQKLPEAIRRYKSKLIVALDIVKLYLDDEVDSSESKVLFNHAVNCLSMLTTEQGIMAIATHTSHPTRVVFDHSLLGRADVCIKTGSQSLEPETAQHSLITDFLDGAAYG